MPACFETWRHTGLVDVKKKEPLTEPTENILAAIYRLTLHSPCAYTKDLAFSLGVSRPTVSEKIVRLAEEGYLDHQWRKGVTLTHEGRAIALRIVRKHRLLETFLFEKLAYAIEEVNEEACALEHAVSDRFIDALDDLLGHPQEDPHGHPIPDRKGTIPFDDHQSLADALPGWRATVRQVSDQDRNHLCYLKELGLVPGAAIALLDVAPFDGPLSLTVDNKSTTLARSMARKVRITVEEPNASTEGDD